MGSAIWRVSVYVSHPTHRAGATDRSVAESRVIMLCFVLANIAP